MKVTKFNRNISLLTLYIFIWFMFSFISIWIAAATPFDFPHFSQSFLAGIISGVLYFLVEKSEYLQKKIRGLKLVWIVFVRVLIYSALIFIVSLIILPIHAFTVLNLSPFTFFKHQVYRTFFTSEKFLIIVLLVVTLAFIVSFTMEILKMLGPGILTKLLRGSYHSPKEENRIFMFLDLNDSTKIAEQLGHARFTEFKNDFFYDLTNPILETRGEVFQYVGDEVVLTWRLKDGKENSNWLLFFMAAKRIINVRAKYYQNKYGIIPEFKAGCDCGTVMTSEIGELKKTIVYSGNPVNSASRIVSYCKQYKRKLLLSENLMELTPLSIDLAKEKVDTVLLRGRSTETTLWTVKVLENIKPKKHK